MLVRGGHLTSGTIQGLEGRAGQAPGRGRARPPLDTTFAAIFQARDLEPDDQEFGTAMAKALEPLRRSPGVEQRSPPDDAPGALALDMAEWAARRWPT